MGFINKPSFSKKEGLGVLTLSCFSVIMVLLALLQGCSSSEIIAQPLRQETKASLAEQQITVTEENTTQYSPSSAVILDIPRPKIHPQVAQEIKAKRQHERVRVLVEAEDDKALEELADAVESAGGTVMQSFSIGDVAVIELPAEKVSEVAQQAGVQEIAPEREYIALLQDRIPAFSIDTAWANNLTGSGATIAILDTGIGPHNAVRVALAKSFIAGEDASDQNGHGTHVAGIAQGVAPGAQLLNAKVLGSSGSGTTSGIIAGINWATDPDGNPETDDGADIISMSFGGMFTELDGPLASAVKEAISRGVVFVAAAGNCRQGCGGFFGVVTPANIKEVIAVGAVDDNNVVASFSSGDTFDDYIKPDITAPGVDITSAWLDNTQKTLSGTSMSAPFASGIIALLLEKEPGLSNGEIKSRLESTADDLGDTGKDTSYGAGVVDVAKLLSQEINTPQNITPIESLHNHSLEGYIAVPADANITPDWITTDCPGDLAYSPELNITREEFFMMYEYCILQVVEKATAFEETNVNDSTGNKTTQMPHIYLKGRFFDPDEVKPETNNSVTNTAFAQSLREKAHILQALNFSTLSNAEPLNSFTAQAAKIKFDDDYYYAGTSTTDAKVWSGGYKAGILGSVPSGTQVVCYDWCSEFNPSYDHCFSTSSTSSGRATDFQQCSAKSSNVAALCDAGRCDIEQEDWHVIPTCGNDLYPPCSPGFAEKCTWKAQYHRNCGSGTYETSSYQSPHYTIKKRQYYCNSIGGLYNDLGDFNGGRTWATFRSNLACPLGYGCDDTKDGSSADFGLFGTTLPDEPCSLLNGYGDCDSDSDCVSNHCSQVSGTDYCCPVGEEWDGSKCAVPCTDNDGDGYGNPGSSSCWKGSSQTDCNDWNSAINPGATETCNSADDNCNGQIDENNVCNPICTITSTQWEPSGTIAEGTTETLRAYGTIGCVGKSLTFKIYEDEPVVADTLMKTITGVTFDGSVFKTTWNAVWVDDGLLQGDPEYYFTATPDVGQGAQSELLSVMQLPCTDNDGDGYGTSGSGCDAGDTLRDCNDNNAGVHPGATEVCDGVDNDCDGNNNENNVCCGNGACDYGETPGTCSKDCFGDLKVISITAPSTVDQGQTVTVQAQIQNKGTYLHTLYVETGIAPDYWEQYGYFMQGYDAQQLFDAQKCCNGNDYYAAKIIRLNPGESQTVTFTVTAPSVSTIDSCWTAADRKSAWDSSHTLVVGLYEQCAGGYFHKLTKDIKVKDKPCTQPSNCGTGEYCKFITATSGICWPKLCTDKCTAGAYSCNGQTIRHCEDTNADYCMEWKDITTCGTGLSCISGQSKCQDTSIDTLLSVEEAGSTTVLAQTGDIISVNLDYKSTETITLEYDADSFILDTNSCPGSTFTITRDMTCNFTVKGTSGDHQFRLKCGTGSGTVRITSYPAGIIITNKPKLYQRLSPAEEVTKLLNKAYAYAQTNNLVLYDVSRYVSTPNPWSQFSSYSEGPYASLLADNEHSLEIGRLVREKCKTMCKNTIILGDDFVIPHYRRDIQFLNTYLFFFNNEKTEQIYSEIPYINRKEKYFSELDDLFYFEQDYNGKKIVFITPPSISSEMQSEIDSLKQVLTAKFKPRITNISSTEVYCDDKTFFSKYDGATLFVIGTEEDNQAYNCFPFVAGLENRDTAFIEVNPWDGRNYAVVVNSEDPNVLYTFTNFIDEEAYKDGMFKEAESKGIYFAKVSLETAAYVGMGVSLLVTIVGTGGLAAPAAFATLAFVADTVSDASSITNDCILGSGTGFVCKTDVVCAAVPFIPSKLVKKLIPFEGLLNKLSDAQKLLIDKYFPKLNKEFGAKLVNKAQRYAEDTVYLAKGSDTIVKEGGSAEDAITKWRSQFGNTEQGKKHALNTIKKIGKYGDEFFEANGLVRYGETNKRIFRADNRHPADIFNKDAGFKAKGTSLDYNEYVAENELNSRYIGASETVEGASHAAISSTNIEVGEGGSWVYIIDPRAKNFVDDLGTLPNPSRGRAIERGVIAIDEIDANDVVGAVYVKIYSDKERFIKEGEIVIEKLDIIKDYTITNPNYKGNLNMVNIDSSVGG